MDNIHLGGIGALIDVENGVIESLACDGSFDTYSYHPISNKKIIGFKIPYWQEVIELVEKAALVTPQLRYVGWDIAITQNGPIIIEGNWDGEFHFLQQMYDKGLKSELYNLLEN